MAEREFTYQTRDRLIKRHENELFSKMIFVGDTARNIAKEFIGTLRESKSYIDAELDSIRDDDTPISFFERTEFKAVMNACIPDKTTREKFALITEKCNQFQYSFGFYRRSVRSKNYGYSIRSCIRLMYDYYAFSIFGVSVSGYLKDELTNEMLDLKRSRMRQYSGTMQIPNEDMIIAAELDYDLKHAGKGELHKTIEDIILGDNNTSAITVPIIRGILKSDDKELHELLGKLLLAARLQEGVRQAICENMDSGTASAFETLFSVIIENNLIRYSGVKRAVATWIGIFNENAFERISNKTLSLMNELLHDEKRRRECLESDDAMELIVALWATGFFEAENAFAELKKIVENGRRNQVLVASYFNKSLHSRYLYAPVSENAVEKFSDDLEVVASFLPTYLDNIFEFRCVWDAEVNGTKYYYGRRNMILPSPWFYGDKERTKRHVQILVDVLHKLGSSKKPKVFEGCAFPWNDVQVSKEEIADRICVMAIRTPGIVEKDIAYEAIENSSFGAIAMKKMLDVRMEKEDKEFALKAMGIKTLRDTAAQMLEEVTLQKDDVIFLESLLHYKDSSLRFHIKNLIAGQNDAGFEESILRLLSEKQEGKRFAALNLISELKDGKLSEHKSVSYAKFEKAVMSIPKPTEKEQILIKSIYKSGGENEKYSDVPKNVDSLYDENNITRFSLSEIHVDTAVIDSICDADRKKLASIIDAFDELVEKHRDDFYTDAYGNDHTLGERSEYCKFGSLCKTDREYDAGKKYIDRYPFKDLWLEFYGTQIKNQKTLMQLYFLSNLPKQSGLIKSFIQSFLPSDEDNSEGKRLCQNATNDIFGKLSETNIGEHEYFSPYTGYRTSLFKDVIEILAYTFLDGEFIRNLILGLKYRILTRTAEKNLWYVPNSEWDKDSHCVLNEIHAINDIDSEFSINRSMNCFLVGEEMDDAEFSDWFKLMFALAEHVGYARHVSSDGRRYARWHGTDGLYPKDYFRAYKLGLITKDTMFYGIIRVHTLSESLDSASFYESSDIEFFEVYMKIHDTIIQNELKRGDSESECSKFVDSVKAVYGAESVIPLIQSLGKTPFERNSIWGYESKVSRTHCLSHLIRISKPSKEDDATKVSELVKEYKVPVQKLYDLAMYAPAWIPLLSEVLGVPSLESGCYYFIAHMNISWGDKRDSAKIAKYTPLSIEELNKGAFDLDWFTEVYSEIGEEVFDRLYESAKYITDGIKHSRSRKFADAALGRVSEIELEKEIVRARNKDLVMSYPLLPLGNLNETEKSEQILHRYEFIQKFKKESRQFGSQRRQSEGEAVEIALENLSRSAGYTDVNRLNLNMESALIEKVREDFEWQDAENYEIRIRIDENGKPSVECRKKGSEKSLKSVPAALKKSEKAVQLQEVHKRLKQQHERTRAMFENFMTDKIELPANEIASLLKNPVVSPIVSSLVFVCEKCTGLLFTKEENEKNEEKIFLRDFDGSESEIEVGTVLRIAHPFDLFKSGNWHGWQKFIFDEKIVQPFKQVFRELYLKLSEELENDSSQMFAGNQIQPNKAAATLKSRRWICDYESGLQKVFYKQNLIAEIYAQADWFSPADIECPAVEYVSFRRRRADENSSWNVKIREIDDIVYSEIMRDVDLAVSVAHAGSVDPETSHSTIEMRRAICEFTLPLFKIQNVRFEKNFAFVKGSRAEYTVHLGTGVIHKTAGGLINIVAVHSQQRGKLFLPFVDEDPKTAEILSKILLLARDESIKDPYILEQILRVES
ncbi:MAG: DUF4132 domain-containing protein [Treponema sp.]|nr:DUF4132 domain-containing protein [Treponema sp.]